MLLEIVRVHKVDVHVLDVLHKIGLLILYGYSCLGLLKFLYEDRPTSPDVDFLAHLLSVGEEIVLLLLLLWSGSLLLG